MKTRDAVRLLLLLTIVLLSIFVSSGIAQTASRRAHLYGYCKAEVTTNVAPMPPDYYSEVFPARAADHQVLKRWEHYLVDSMGFQITKEYQWGSAIATDSDGTPYTLRCINGHSTESDAREDRNSSVESRKKEKYGSHRGVVTNWAYSDEDDTDE